MIENVWTITLSGDVYYIVTPEGARKGPFDTLDDARREVFIMSGIVIAADGG